MSLQKMRLIKMNFCSEIDKAGASQKKKRAQ